MHKKRFQFNHNKNTMPTDEIPIVDRNSESWQIIG